MINKDVKELTELLADLLFSYVNKDEKFNHQFENETAIKVCNYLDKFYSGNKYSENFFKHVKQSIKAVK